MSLKGTNNTIADCPQKKIKKKKELYLFGSPIKDYMPIVFFFSVITAISIIISTIGEYNHWARISAIYLGICFVLYYCSSESDKQDNNYEIAQLKQKIRTLESNKQCDKNIIELLEKELAKAQDNSHQE